MIALEWFWNQSRDKAPSIGIPKKARVTEKDSRLWHVKNLEASALDGGSPAHAGFPLNQCRINGIGVTWVLNCWSAMHFALSLWMLPLQQTGTLWRALTPGGAWGIWHGWPGAILFPELYQLDGEEREHQYQPFVSFLNTYELDLHRCVKGT